MNRLQQFLTGLFIISVGGCVCTIVQEAIHQRQLERKALEFQRSCTDQQKLQKQLEQIQVIEEN